MNRRKFTDVRRRCRFHRSQRNNIRAKIVSWDDGSGSIF